jgi:chitin-binding protein
LPAGDKVQFLYKATAPHKGRFELYVTVDGYDPGQPLRWSDLESKPFYAQSDPKLVDGAYVMDVKLPAGKTGHHVIYTIWQRSDSPEAFYSCADVIFGDGRAQTATHKPPTKSPEPSAHDHGSSPEPSASSTHEHGAEPSQAATPEPTETEPGVPVTPAVPAVEPWETNHTYAVGDRVSFEGRIYVCVQGHTSLPDWRPNVVPALWLVAHDSSSGTASTWEPQVSYAVGDQVVHDGKTYRARQAHVSLPSWEPPNTPALWELVQ